jgi:hypothetical protein
MTRVDLDAIEAKLNSPAGQDLIAESPIGELLAALIAELRAAREELTATRRYIMTVEGPAGPPISFSTYRGEYPTKLWEATSAILIGPPHYRASRPLAGRILEVIDRPSRETVRRTLWRIP